MGQNYDCNPRNFGQGEQGSHGSSLVLQWSKGIFRQVRRQLPTPRSDWFVDIYFITESEAHLNVCIASKNHKHSVKNPYSQFRDGWSEEQVLKAPQITNEMTKLMCCPTSDGGEPASTESIPVDQIGFFLAACCIVASEAFVRKHKLENQVRPAPSIQ